MPLIHVTIDPALVSRAAAPLHAIRRLADGPDAVGRLVGLTEACQGPDGPAITAAGLGAEIRSRPGRRVTAWIATRLGGDGAAAGVVTLVESVPAAGAPPRHSIGWLLVDPAERRGGLGTALVATAVAEAFARGADRVTAETRSDWEGATAFWRGLSALHGGDGPDGAAGGAEAG
jgi:ribosomal protein S18 acetylase RimI-like enzyme